jgi:hypothetical protein
MGRSANRTTGQEGTMVDERARHGRRLRRLRRATRRWSVLAGALVSAAAVLTPYSGVSLIDAVWAAAAGGAVMTAGWRWVDYRALAAQPLPPVVDPAVAADRARMRVEALVATVPWGREVVDRVHRHADRTRVRGSAVASGWRRLDRAAAVLSSLPLRQEGPAETAALQAAVAEKGLRELATRAAGLQCALPYGAPPQSLGQAHDALVAEFEQGVWAYEELVGAAAAYVAEEGRTSLQRPSLSHLAEATELLRGIAEGLAELRQVNRLTG